TFTSFRASASSSPTIGRSHGSSCAGFRRCWPACPRVRVRFQIDANGILSVTAREERTDVEQTIEVKPSYGLSDEEVERMLIDSFEHAGADLEARLLVDARNDAETVIQATEKALRAPEFADIAREDLSPDEPNLIVSALRVLEDALVSSDRAAIQQRTQALNDATARLAEALMNRSLRSALAGKNIDSLS